MSAFARGKVYALTHAGNVFYVGSTVQSLDARLRVAGHRLKAFQCPGRMLYRRFAEVGAENVAIVLLSTFPCESRDALLAEERRLILEHATHTGGCNARVAGGRQDGGWKARNREKHLAYCREWNRAKREGGLA